METKPKERMMKIYDISIPISPEMVVWPADPKVELARVSSMDAGAHANVSRLACGVHTGTHVDAPNHFLDDQRTVESLPVDILTGPAQVIQIPDEEDFVTAQVLEAASVLKGTIRLLVKTRNSKIWAGGGKEFHPEFVGIDEAGADWIVQHGIRLIGIDYLSVAPYKHSEIPHQVLLKPGVIILEGIDLSTVQPGSYDLYCLPLKLVGSDGAPARAILVEK
jgi:arylformamidase